MFGAQRHYYIGLAVFIVLLSFTFFLFHEDDAIVYDKYDKHNQASKVPYRCPSSTEGCAALTPFASNLILTRRQIIKTRLARRSLCLIRIDKTRPHEPRVP
jgi:hypothetical protein